MLLIKSEQLKVLCSSGEKNLHNKSETDRYKLKTIYTYMENVKRALL